MSKSKELDVRKEKVEAIKQKLLEVNKSIVASSNDISGFHNEASIEHVANQLINLEIENICKKAANLAIAAGQHVFKDGNKRTANLLINKLLSENGLIIQDQEKIKEAINKVLDQIADGKSTSLIISEFVRSMKSNIELSTDFDVTINERAAIETFTINADEGEDEMEGVNGLTEVDALEHDIVKSTGAEQDFDGSNNASEMQIDAEVESTLEEGTGFAFQFADCSDPFSALAYSIPLAGNSLPIMETDSFQS